VWWVFSGVVVCCVVLLWHDNGTNGEVVRVWVLWECLEEGCRA
jgi:hypothetical protein